MMVRLGVTAKIVLAIAAVGLVAALALSFFASASFTYSLEEKIIDEVRHNAMMDIGNVDRFMYERMVDIEILGGYSPVLSDPGKSAEEKIRYMHEFERDTDVYASISMYDTEGRRVLDTRGFGIGDDESNYTYIKEALAGKAYHDGAPSALDALGVPVIRFSAPLYSGNGTLVGAVVTRLLASRLGMVMGVTENDRVEILDREGLVLFSTFDKNAELSQARNAAELFAGQTELAPEYLNLYVNEPRFYAMADQMGFAEFPGDGWMLVYEIDSRAALAPVNAIRNKIFLLGVGTVLILIGMFYILTESVVLDPLMKMHKAAVEVENGNYKARVGWKNSDEMGELSGAFDRAIETLEKTDAQRRQLDKSKTEFMSITSHELRSPMTPMKAQLQMLDQGYFGRLSARQKESVGIVLRNTDRLDKIIVDMLEISRIEAARLKFNFVETDLSAPVKSLCREMRGFMPEKKVKIVLKLGRLEKIMADPDRAMQVLRNLLTNAIKFSKENGSVLVGAKYADGAMEFSVQDFGIGMNDVEKMRIFEPFYQAEPAMTRKYGGTGLGLAICKGIVETQGGRIWFESEPGRGATFRFSLPAKPAQNMKPISMVFASKAEVENAVRKIFARHLGPMGEREFEELRKKNGLNYLSLRGYFKKLEGEGVIDSKVETEMELEAVLALTPKKSVAKKEGEGAQKSDNDAGKLANA